MVLVFLLLTLLVGFCASQKATSFREYVVGNKRFSTVTLMATLLATCFGGGALITNVIRVHHNGLWWIIHMLFSTINFWLISRLSLHMGPFMQDLSIADTIGKIYGKYPRLITALFCMAFYIIVANMQIHAMSLAIKMCIDSIDPRMITILATLILIIYATFGGIRSVTTTDVLQFITLTIIIFLLAKLLFAKTDKPILEIVSCLKKQENFQLSSSYRLKPLSLFFLMLQNVALSFDLLSIPKVYMSSSPIQAKKVFLYGNFFGMLIFFAIVLIGLFVFIINPTLPEMEVWEYIMANISPTFKGCIAIVLLAMTMSTADSSLHACSIVVSHDMMEIIQGTKGSPSHAYQIRLAKLTVIATGLLAMLLSLYYKNPLELIIWGMALSTPIISAPFILAIFGFRGTSRTALIGMAISVLATLSWNKWIKPLTGIEGDFYCIMANGLAMMAAHYLLPQPAGKGWVGINDQYKRMQQLIRAFKKYKKTIDLE